MCAQLREIGNKLVTVGWKSVAVGWKSVAAGCKLEASSRACMPVIKVIPAQQWGTGCGGREALLGEERWAMLRSPALDLKWDFGSWDRGLSPCPHRSLAWKCDMKVNIYVCLHQCIHTKTLRNSKPH